MCLQLHPLHSGQIHFYIPYHLVYLLQISNFEYFFIVSKLDIFYARVTPSKTFDILKDDFDFLLIAAVLIALVTFSYLAKLLAARKSLNAAWK